MTGAYNPLDLDNLGTSVVNALLSTDPHPMDSVPSFGGAGIYAIYYQGDFPAYAPLAQVNRDGGWRLPIYVGKAIPAGGRRGLSVATSTRSLSARLRQHASSIDEATNLSVQDFSARWLVVESIWIPLGESLLISRYRPVWNALVDGFGNHNPGRGRISGLGSRWDTIHPGRSWASNFRARPESASDIEAEALEYLRARTIRTV